MKRYFLTFLFCIIVYGVYAQVTEQNIYSVTNGSIECSPKFIEKFYNEDTKNIKPYQLKNLTEISINNQIYSAYMYMYNGYAGDPGDFEVISILNPKKQTIFELNNELGWVRIPSTIDSTSPYYLMGIVDTHTKALITIGYPYESTPEWLTIVLLQENSAKLVFNKHYIIEKFVKTDSSFTLYIADSCESEQEGAKVNHFMIYPKNGILQIKKTN